MHHILIAIKEIIDSNLKLYLPHVASDHLENNGAVYYMNGKDGTEFDWYINEKFPPFMVFYNDKANLGAVCQQLDSDISNILICQQAQDSFASLPMPLRQIK